MNKFEQLLDYLVNEDMEKANELFHEIVVEKSREIYENLISEEAEEEEEMDEASEEDDEAVEEASDDEDEDEAVEEETTLEIGGDPADALAGDVQDPMAPGMDMGGEDPMAGDMGDEMGGGSIEDEVDDLKADFEKLKADFEALARGEDPMAGDDGEEDPFASDDDGEEDDSDDEEGEESDDDGDDEEEESSMPFEGRLREYTEKVSDGHGAEKKGRGEDAGTNTKSTGLQNPSGRPTTTASAHNILGQKGGEAGIKGGEGLVGKPKGEFTKGGTHNVNGVKSGVKTLGKVPAGHGPEKKGPGEPGGTNTKSLVDRKQ